MLNNLEKQTSIPKTYAFLGIVGLYFFFIFFNFGGQLLTNFAGFIIPGYYSLEALFSTSTTDDTQWLTVRKLSVHASTLTNITPVLGCILFLDRRRVSR